jgi:hypothetical protein
MSLSITTEWEQLYTGPPEEMACFAAIGIFSGNISLTEADDAFVNLVRSSVHLSAYKLAEWFAWNWWRQRWEPRTPAGDWAMAHHMTTIGGGYVWPNITVISDGERVVLVAKPTEPRLEEPLRYITDIAVVFRAIEFEGAVSRFIEQVQGQLRAEEIETTNLDQVWTDVCAERRDTETVERRRLEALLGFDPDEADVLLLDRLVAEAAELGEKAVREIAATSSGGGQVPTVDSLKEIARTVGFDARPNDAVRLHNGTLPQIGEVAAWRRGTEAAQELRAQEGLGAGSISNGRLASMSGVAASNLTKRTGSSDLSFALDNSDNTGHVVLRSKWKTGRRFELARLLGDRIAGGGTGRLFPATRTHTYRQKLQRSFAAELLCPFEAIDDMLQGDYSEEKQEECAEHFSVSPLTVRTLLVNHGRIDRDDLYGEFETAPAA